ncbi:MAG: DinB family protein [Chloroflexi bacterium]|nr:DinB family protein [Chloroflexota bacterium]
MDSLTDAIRIMETTPVILRAIIAMASPEALERRPGEEAWSAHDVLAHLLHVETAVIGERVRRMITEENPLFGPTPVSTPPSSIKAALDAWAAARQENLTMLRGLRPDQLERAGQHPRYGRITVREHVIEWAYHDLDHLRQILAALQVSLYPQIGPFQALYPPPS